MKHDKKKHDKKSKNWPSSKGTGVCQRDQHASDTQQSGRLSSEDLKEIRNVIRKKYAEVSVSADGKFQYPTGRDGAIALGYDPAIVQKADPKLLESFCGVGNPFSLGEIRHGDVVLDFGCGGGFDLFVAGTLVGESGRVCGIDLTEEMVKRARDNLAGANITNIEIRKVDSEDIPYAGRTFDVIISNGVINLSPGKDMCFREIYRVLKPGGRIQFADVVLENKLPADLSGSLEAWSQWIGGTIPVGDQISLLKKAGFSEVKYAGATGFHTSKYTVGALFAARKPVVTKSGWISRIFGFFSGNSR